MDNLSEDVAEMFAALEGCLDMDNRDGGGDFTPWVGSYHYKRSGTKLTIVSRSPMTRGDSMDADEVQLRRSALEVARRDYKKTKERGRRAAVVRPNNCMGCGCNLGPRGRGRPPKFAKCQSCKAENFIAA